MSGNLKTTMNTYNEPRLPQLDAVRGIACLMVLFAHLKSVSWVAWLPEWVGTAGVGIFFSLSGFLITRGLLVDGDLARFYTKRVARIFPIYYLTLVVLSLMGPRKEIRWAADFTFNIRYLASSRDYFRGLDAGAIPPVAHFWSLCVEEHFYWIWPIVVLIVPRRWLWLVPAIVIVLTPHMTEVLNIRLSNSGMTETEVSGLLSRITPTQLVAISIGAFIAIFERRLVFAPLAGLACILVGSGLMMKHGMPLWQTTALHFVCGGVFLLGLAAPWLGRILLLAQIGKISYGLYLYHLPIYAAMGALDTTAGGSPIWGIAAFAINCGVAAISYRFIESPILAAARTSIQSQHRRKWYEWSGLIATAFVLLLFVRGINQFLSPPAPLNDNLKSVSRSEIDSIIVGSSHAYYGIKPSELSGSAYNLAFTAQDIWYDCKIVKKSVDEFPNLTRVLFTISALSYRDSIADRDELKWREQLYFYTWKFQARDDTGDRIYSKIGISEVAFAAEQKKSRLIDEPNRGWVGLSAADWDVTTGAASAAKHLIKPSQRRDQNRELLVKAIQNCQKHKIECVLVVTPKHRSYLDNLDAKLAEETARISHDVAEQTAVRLLDYSADTRFEVGDFFDADHLNENGAVKFTRILNDNLKSQN